MDEFHRVKLIVAGTISLLLMAAFFLLIDFKKPVTPTVSPPTPPTATATPTPMPTCTDTERDDAALTLLGLDRSSARVGSQVRWSLVPKGAPAGSFVTGGARSKDELDKALVSSKPLRRLLSQQLGQQQMSTLNADDFVAIQPLKPLVLKGNHVLKNGQVLRYPKTTQSGEALWVYVDENCQPQGIAVLVICANPTIVRRDWVVVRE